MKLRSLVLTFVLSCVFVPSASAQTLYAADGGGGTLSNLYIVNPATGAIVSTVGPIGFSITGLAFNPFTDVLYGSTGREAGPNPGSLIIINKATGAGSLVGPYGLGGETMADITFTTDGTLYGWSEPGNDDLFTVNIATGAATLVGDSGLSTSGSGLAANAANVIYFAGAGLQTISRVTGAATFIGPLTGATSRIGALAFDSGGNLFGGQNNGNLVRVNTASGAVTIVGFTVANLDAIAFDPFSGAVPALPTVMLWTMAILLATMSLWLISRRRAVSL